MMSAAFHSDACGSTKRAVVVVASGRGRRIGSTFAEIRSGSRRSVSFRDHVEAERERGSVAFITAIGFPRSTVEPRRFNSGTRESDRRAQIGITDHMVRVSVGIEDVDDLKEDLEQALARIS